MSDYPDKVYVIQHGETVSFRAANLTLNRPSDDIVYQTYVPERLPMAVVWGNDDNYGDNAYCPNCDVLLAPDQYKYCGHCGQPLVWEGGE